VISRLVFQIRDVFAKNSDPRILTLDYRSGSGSFFRCISRPKIKFKFFCVFFTEGTFTSVFKDKKSLRSHKTVEIKICLKILARGWKDPDPTNNYGSGSGPKSYGSYGFGSGTLLIRSSL
jgi:hypothetical protein